MLRMMIALPVLLASAAMAFSELPDSSGRAVGLDSLARKIDSLEAGLVKLKMEKQDHEIYAIGDALDWGKGFGGAFRLSESGYGLEVNYNLPALGFDKPHYLGNYRSVGMGLGFDEYVNDNPMRRTLFLRE